MRTFLTFLTESLKKMPWKTPGDIGWWEDQETLTLYHGTHIKNVDAIAKTGLDRMDPTTGMISLTLDPFTARGYASMSGGESNFRQAGQKAKITPMNERAVLIFEIPTKWIVAHMDKNLGGNVGDTKKNMQDKTRFEKFTGPHSQYYQLSEFRVNTIVPPKFLKGYMVSS
jgi:hypothetical protein